MRATGTPQGRRLLENAWRARGVAEVHGSRRTVGTVELLDRPVRLGRHGFAYLVGYMSDCAPAVKERARRLASEGL